MNKEVSLRGFAREMGVTLRAVQLAIKAGRVQISRTEQHGQRQRHFINLGTAAVSWEARRDPAKRLRPTRGEAGKGPQPYHTKPEDREEAGGQGAPAGGPAGPSGTKGGYMQGDETFHKARAARELFTAKTAELDYKVKTGELVKMEKVREVFYSTGAAIREGIMQIPARISPILAAESNEKKINALLVKEFTQVLKLISENKLDLAGNGGD